MSPRRHWSYLAIVASLATITNGYGSHPSSSTSCTVRLAFWVTKGLVNNCAQSSCAGGAGTVVTAFSTWRTVVRTAIFAAVKIPDFFR